MADNESEAVETADNQIDGTQQELTETGDLAATAGNQTNSESQDTDSQEIEIVRRSGGSQPPQETIDAIIRKRVGKLNSKVSQANTQATEANAALEQEREKNKLLQLALEQAKGVSNEVRPPNPDDYLEGVTDSRYQQELHSYNQKMIDDAVKKRTADLVPPAPAKDDDLLRKQEQYARRSHELGARDFDEMESKLIDRLGNSVVNDIIKFSGKPAEVIYYLGKNGSEADEFAHLARTNAAMALLKLGRLESDLEVRPRSNVNHTPNPDEELENTTQGTNTFQQQYERAMKKVLAGEAKVGSLRDIKRKAKEAGVTIER